MATVVVTEPVTSGSVILKTSLGDIAIELWAREAPKAVRNFVQLALEGYYDGCKFHRIVPGFIAQTGDQTGTGTGGESIYDEGFFEDEISQRLKFNRRGIVGMANQGSRDTNLSQFFITLDRADSLQNKHTVFGRIAGDTIFNVLKMSEVEMAPGSEDQPLYAPVIRSIEVVDNPFDDITPRITAAERREQERAKRESKLERAKAKEQSKRKGTKNKALLSFGAGEEGDGDAPPLPKKKFMSAHDALDDERLSKQVAEDVRGTHADLPDWLENMPGDNDAAKKDDGPKRAPPAQQRKQEYSIERATDMSASDKDKAAKRKAELAKVQADLMKMSKRHGSDDEDEPKAKKQKKSGLDGAALLAARRAQFAGMQRGAPAPAGDRKGKAVAKAEDEESLGNMLNAFRSRLAGARDTAPAESGEAFGGDDDRDEFDDNEDVDDDTWLAHKLVFRKDATLERQALEEYETIDPLARSRDTLAEIEKQHERRDRVASRSNASGRMYPGDERRAARTPNDDRREQGRGGRGR